MLLGYPGETRIGLIIAQHFYWKYLSKTLHEVCSKCKSYQFLKRNKKQYRKLSPKEEKKQTL